MAGRFGKFAVRKKWTDRNKSPNRRRADIETKKSSDLQVLWGDVR